MNISIRKPIGYSQIGRKDQQEDAVWPSFNEVSCASSCIVLCDGVGGSEHGEVASLTSSKIIGEYLTSVIRDKQVVAETDVQIAVNLAYDELEKIDTERTEDGVVSMATTLTCVCFHNDGVLAAHMGDSRIYHIRPGQGVLYESRDHSLVRNLLDSGDLTEEEAKNFTRKNVITKAIQPHAGKRLNAEVKLLSDIKSGDYIFLCCDGVLEQLTVGRLFQILSMNCSDEEKLVLLEAESTDKTKDNYTAYLIPIDNVEGGNSSNDDDDVSADEVEVEIVNDESIKVVPKLSSVPPLKDDTPSIQIPPQSKKKSITSLVVVIIVLLALLAVLLVKFLNGGTIKSSDELKNSTEQIDTIKNNPSNIK